ncbi:4-(cytidine 5'-diphospho)-2-C-methyl-D-erythritol kinase [Brevundimonas balnearis]|uniref:4-diphosphocytidyl-2-C-methyl-D-erythritol kinase n=1 Tax=Brevundimonas balnearis TaxID=1572858 RepID=A0ABV6R2U6_9CAUL
MPLTALAPAKVNLFLHVGPPGADGYHPLASLVAFADVGDKVSLTLADRMSFEVTGPFADALVGEVDNLVARALGLFAAAAGRPGPAFAATLDKRLPVAAGLGGGSSDAGAALRLANQLTGDLVSAGELEKIAGALGADGPMCLRMETAWATGRGDALAPEARLPRLPAVLVNPRAPSPTGAVYRAYDVEVRGSADLPDPPASWTLDGVIDWLRSQRNDLEAPAVRLEPRIGEVLSLVGEAPEAALTRMSGSGATVFALCRSGSDAASLAARVSAQRPDWWVARCGLGG